MLHELGDKRVGLLHRPPRRVNKAGLDIRPPGAEALGRDQYAIVHHRSYEPGSAHRLGPPWLRAYPWGP